MRPSMHATDSVSALITRHLPLHAADVPAVPVPHPNGMLHALPSCNCLAGAATAGGISGVFRSRGAVRHTAAEQYSRLAMGAEAAPPLRPCEPVGQAATVASTHTT